MSNLLANPVNTFQSWYFTKMLGIVCDHRQTKMSGGDGNHNVEIANGQSMAGERMPNLRIVTSPIAKRQNNKRLFNLSWLFKMFLYSLAVKCSVCKFSNAYLRGKNLICRSISNMLVYPTAMMEILYPSVGIKDKSFHNKLIVKIYFAIKGTTVVAMLHHLIVLLALSVLRPYTCHFQKFGFAFFCRKIRRCLFGHNQLFGQPLTVTLRERKSLQISP